MIIYKLVDLRDRYVVIYSLDNKPQLYLVIPINDEEGVAVWIEEIK